MYNGIKLSSEQKLTFRISKKNCKKKKKKSETRIRFKLDIHVVNLQIDQFLIGWIK